MWKSKINDPSLKKEVLAYIEKNESVSTSEISRRFKISFPTCRTLLFKLAAEGLLEQDRHKLFRLKKHD